MARTQSITQNTSALSQSDTHGLFAIQSATLSRTAVLGAFLFLFLLGLGIRLVTYDRFLPFQDRTDESVYQVTSLHRRGVELNNYVEVYYASQPPAYIWLTMILQPFTESGRPWTLLADYLYTQRLLAVLIGILTMAVVMRLGWLLGGTAAAWFAGLVWAFSPEIIDNNNQAVPDPFVYLTVAASLVMVIQALRSSSPRWLFGGLLMGIVAIYFKYTPVYVLIPWGIVALILLRRSSRRMLPWLAAQALVGLVSARYLIVNYAALDLPNREVETFRSEGLLMAFDPWRIFNNLWSAMRPIDEVLFMAVVAFGLLAFFYNQRRQGRRLDVRWWVILLVYGGIGLLMISSYTNVWEANPKYRHTMPVTIAMLGLWSAAIAQIFWAVPGGRQMKILAGAVIALCFVIPAASQNARAVQLYQRVYTHNLLWRWTDANIPPDGRILTRDSDMLESVWNRWWGGYDGKTSFEWWHEVGIPQNTPAEYRERGIFYFAVTDADLTSQYNGRERRLQDFVDEIVYVKTIRNDSPDVVGPMIHFYRIVPPQIEANAAFDDRMNLIGYDLNTDNLRPGGTFTFRPYWRVTDTPRSNYSMFAHLIRSGETSILAQQDGPPAQIGRPTLTWTDRDELYIGSDVQLVLPEGLEPGRYELLIGLYDYLTGERLRLDNGEDHFTIELTVHPA